MPKRDAAETVRPHSAVAKSSPASLTFRSGALQIMRPQNGMFKTMSKKQGSPSAMQQRVNAEIQDNLDEDLELELEDSDLADLLADGHSLPRKRGLSAPSLFQGAAAPAARAHQAAGLGGRQEAQARRHLRGPRRGRQGRRHQARHPAAQPARLPRRGAARRRASASAANGISSATSPICRPAARSCCSTAAGTTAPASSA